MANNLKGEMKVITLISLLFIFGMGVITYFDFARITSIDFLKNPIYVIYARIIEVVAQLILRSAMVGYTLYQIFVRPNNRVNSNKYYLRYLVFCQIPMVIIGIDYVFMYSYTLDKFNLFVSATYFFLCFVFYTFYRLSIKLIPNKNLNDEQQRPTDY